MNESIDRSPMTGRSQPHRLHARLRFQPWLTLAAVYVLMGAVLRCVLWYRFGRHADVTALQFAGGVLGGAVNDIIESLYLFAALALYLLLATDRWFASKFNRTILVVGSVLTLFGLLYLCAVEYYFFEEFDARFNLVAFDYLMYPTEVVGDINASYPVKPVMFACAALSLAIFALLRSRLVPPVAGSSTLKQRLRPVIVYTVAVLLAALLIKTDLFAFSNNRVANELTANGSSSFFQAARTSELKYPAYYATRDSQRNRQQLADFLRTQGGVFTHLDEGRLDRRFAANPNGLGKLNVVVVAEESFGAEFSKLYGSSSDSTPNFDAYAQRGLWFKNMYASGTRTVRGLEAITASFPPIPSVSILRRPNNENIATWGAVMQQQGYRTSFIYGGYGYFDNMNYFYAHNGFEVIDRKDIDKVRFANIWGVSDEDLFDRALTYYDERANNGEPFFSIIMSTSNHKPFTFREGVPGVPAKGGGRGAGVRYADFAIGYFLKQAEQHPWFRNTVFVIVADHGARVYGKEEVPLRTYEIPMMIYSPAHIQPRAIDTLTGQIDIAPTVLGLLGLPYEAPFFGTDVLACEKCERIALFSHNHDVAIYRNEKLSVLHLGKTTETLIYNRAADSYTKVEDDPQLTDLAIAFYQTGYELFRAHRYDRVPWATPKSASSAPALQH